MLINKPITSNPFLSEPAGIPSGTEADIREVAQRVTSPEIPAVVNRGVVPELPTEQLQQQIPGLAAQQYELGMPPQQVIAEPEASGTDVFGRTVYSDQPRLRNLSPEEQAAGVEEQGYKLAETTKTPDFNTPQMANQFLVEGLKQVGGREAYTNWTGKVNYLDKIRAKNENPYLEMSTQYNNSLQRLQNMEGPYASQEALSNIVNEFNITDDNSKNAFPGALNLAVAKGINDITTRRYKTQNINSDGPESDELSEAYDDLFAEDEAPSGDMDIVDKATQMSLAQEALRNPEKQPMLRGFMSSLLSDTKKFMNRPDSPTGLGIKGMGENTAAAATLFLDQLDKGFIELGVTKSGRYIPIPTAKGVDFSNAHMEGVTLVDPESRMLGIREPLIRSAKTPTVAATFADKRVVFAQNGQIKSGSDKINDVAINELNNVAVRSKVENLNMLRGMFSHIIGNSYFATAQRDNKGKVTALGEPRKIEGFEAAMQALLQQSQEKFPAFVFVYSDSPYASYIGDITKDRYQEAIEEHTRDGKTDFETVAPIAFNKVLQKRRHIEDYIPNTLEGMNFGNLKISEHTNRMFEQATDISQGNHSDTVRATMGFAVQPKVRISGDLNTMLKSVENTFNKLDGLATPGIKGGYDRLNYLTSLPDEKLAMAGAMYMIASSAYHLGLINKQSLPQRFTPTQLMKRLTPQVIKKMVEYGGEAFKFSSNQAILPPDPNQTIDGWLSKSGERKEWNNHFDSVLMAYEIYKTAEQGGGYLNLRAVMEKDSTQSNADIISTLVGDEITFQTLGGDLGLIGDQVSFSDLRSKAASNIPHHLDLAFRGEDDVDIKESLKVFFNTTKQALGESAFNKWYGRSLVVAGLYGKYPAFMYDELSKMLMSASSNGAGQAVNDLIKEFKNDKQKAIEALATVYETSFKTEMPKLASYQSVMKKVGEFTAAVYGGSMFPGFGGREINMASAVTLTGLDEIGKLAGLSIDDININGEKINVVGYRKAKDVRASGFDTADAEQIARAQEQSKNLLGEGYKPFFTAGNSLRKALPVNLIQSGDSFKASAATVLVNDAFKRNKNKDIPSNTRWIHDAFQADPSSILPMLYAYNDIVPHLVAKEAQLILDKTIAKVDKDFARAIGEAKHLSEKKEKANIGANGKYAGLSGYFDRIWANIRTNEITTEQGGKVKFKTSETNVKTIDLALEFGWKPPTERYLNNGQAENNYIDAENFARLLHLMREHSGLSMKRQSGKHFLPSYLVDKTRNDIKKIKETSDSFNKMYLMKQRGSNTNVM